MLILLTISVYDQITCTNNTFLDVNDEIEAMEMSKDLFDKIHITV